MALFKELLQVEHIDSDSHFFHLGGDSLLAALLIYRAYEAFGVEINIDAFADSPTPARIAGLIGAAANHDAGGIRSQ